MKGIASVVLSPNNQYIASGCHDGHLKIWDVVAGKVYRTFNLIKYTDFENIHITDVAFSPVECTVAVSASDKQIRHFDIMAKELVSSTPQDVHLTYKIDFDPNGEYLYAGNGDAMKVFSSEKGSIQHIVPKSSRKIVDLVASRHSEHVFILEHYNDVLNMTNIAKEELFGEEGVGNTKNESEVRLNNLEDDFPVEGSHVSPYKPPSGRKPPVGNGVK